MGSLREVERRLNRLIAADQECERLDIAAGDPVEPKITIGEWVRDQMKTAAIEALEVDNGQG
jgi:hypothetical protein